ncbi:S8 family serine peptidase, partial [Daejeonella sp. H1SJ63]|uniref:S8 family serine peptidase n=1 Tax=Daejeonella sp. H1SJ63 TaxID=3034145 RepID=UPI0023ED4715
MKRIITLFMLIVTVIFGLMAFRYFQTPAFYYAFDEKITISPHENKIIIKYSVAKDQRYTATLIHSIEKDAELNWQDDKVLIIEARTGAAKEKIRERLLAETDILSIQPVFKTSEGLELGLTDEFVFKFKPSVSEAQINTLNKQFDVTIVKSSEVYQLARVGKGIDVLEVANKYQESGLVIFSHPNFIAQIEKHQVLPNDQFFNNQFNLHNTGQVFNDGHSGAADADIDAPEAWTMTTGNNAIIIAVLDEGVSPDHPDLPNTRQVRLNGSNFGNGDPNDPSPQNNNNHGNSSAGLIAASQNNNEGISGIAPNCRIMPVRIFNGDCSGIAVDRLAAAIDFARLNGADIISNSWGFGRGATNPNLFPVIVEAIQTATTQGRGGLGCVVAFSASNSADHAIGDNGEIRFPSNVNIAGVLTVGASDRNDLQANYSPTSNPASGNNQIIDIVAPSHRAYPNQIAGETFEVWTMDIPGNVGYNPWPSNIGNCQFVNPPFVGEQIPGAGVNFNAYTARFGGTSASCPQVAAVAALVLSMNPNLTQQQVFDILTNSADDVGGYNYTNGVSNELGGGRLNACAAVTRTLAISGPDNFCTSGTYTINLPAGATVSWSVSPS